MGKNKNAFAATTEESMKDVYNRLLLISTVAAVVKVATVPLIINFSNVILKKEYLSVP